MLVLIALAVATVAFLALVYGRKRKTLTSVQTNLLLAAIVVSGGIAVGVQLAR